MLGGENVTLGEFYRLVGKATGAKIPTLRFPDGIAKAAGAAQKAWARLRGTTPQLTPDLVEIYKHDWAYSSGRAEKELGYRCASAGRGAGLDGRLAQRERTDGEVANGADPRRAGAQGRPHGRGD